MPNDFNEQNNKVGVDSPHGILKNKLTKLFEEFKNTPKEGEAFHVLNEFYHRTYWNADSINGVLQYTIDCHEGQLRKDESTPYILHPIRVACRVSRFLSDYHYQLGPYNSMAMIKAALLHDTIEDCSARYDEILNIADYSTMEFVFWLTDIDTNLGNRTIRKYLSSVRLRSSPTSVQIIKLADILDNIYTSDSLQDEFFCLFCTEKVETIDMIYKSNPENEAIKMICASVRQTIFDKHRARTGENVRGYNIAYG